MSRWQRDFCRLALGTSGVSLTRGHHGKENSQRFAVKTAPDARTRWSASLDAAGPALASLEDSESLDVAVVLCGAFVRYRRVPWEAAFTSPALRAALARHCFVDAYGESVARWTICLSDNRYGAATLACALDTELLEALRDMIKGVGARMISVRPLLMDVHNEHAALLKTELCWFVLCEPERLTVLLWRDGVPSSVRVVDAGPSDLGVVLDREWVRAGIDLPPCPVFYWEQEKSTGPLNSGRWRVIRLRAHDEQTLELRPLAAPRLEQP